MSDSFATLWAIALQASLSVGFLRQGYWSGLPCPSPGDLPNSGTEPASPGLQADSFTTEPSGRSVSCPSLILKMIYFSFKNSLSQKKPSKPCFGPFSDLRFQIKEIQRPLCSCPLPFLDWHLWPGLLSASLPSLLSSRVWRRAPLVSSPQPVGGQGAKKRHVVLRKESLNGSIWAALLGNCRPWKLTLLQIWTPFLTHWSIQVCSVIFWFTSLTWWIFPIWPV